KLSKMRTFNQEVEYFSEKYSYEKLYLSDIYSYKNMTLLKIFLILFIVCFLIGDIMMITKFYAKIGFIIMLVSALPTITHIFIIRTYRARKILKSKGLPLPKEPYRWQSIELESLRIKEVYKEYSNMSNKELNAKIKLAEELRNEPMNNPFKVFEKVSEFIGKQFVLMLITIVLFLYKGDPSIEHLEFIFRFITGILLFLGIISFTWEYLFKKIYFDEKSSKNNKLKDFAFTLKNILIMKKETN
ncbi:MAG: hypothetical protein KGV59_05670, partial [Tenacibaculum sp.]|nr:hypothetical protein [Tenacibaculum sp.]